MLLLIKLILSIKNNNNNNYKHLYFRSEIALIYNDRAVLENYHISTTFKLMTNDSFNILQELSRAEYK
jgi:calcium/calmodulin-dependent 3',5'-cyclic nucleotide phosphodiesterase